MGMNKIECRTDYVFWDVAYDTDPLKGGNKISVTEHKEADDKVNEDDDDSRQRPAQQTVITSPAGWYQPWGVSPSEHTVHRLTDNIVCHAFVEQKQLTNGRTSKKHKFRNDSTACPKGINKQPV